MKIGIISDTHDNFKSIKDACKIFIDNGVKVVFHCGDLVSSESFKFIDKRLKFNIVFGNVDDTSSLQNDIFKYKHISLLGYLGHIEINEKDILIYHGDLEEKLLEYANSLKYDYIFTGHTHKKKDEIINNTRIINPGAHNFENTNKIDRTIAILDLISDELKYFFLIEE